MLVAIMAVVEAPHASAHAFLLRSTPTDGSTLARAPATMRLTFDEDVRARDASLTLRSANGSVVLPPGSSAAASPTSSDTGPQLVFQLPALGKGDYTASWSVRSADDLHRTTGTLSFAIGQPDQPRAVDLTGPTPKILSSLVRWLDVTGIAVLLGALLLMAAVVPRSRVSPRDSAALRSILWRTLTLAAAAELSVGIVVLFDSAGVADVPGVLTSAGFGRLWLLREASFAAVAVLSLRAARRIGSSRLNTVAAIALTVTSLAAVAGTSHVGVGTARPLTQLLLLAHLSFAGAWAGGVLLLMAFQLLERTQDMAFQSGRLMRSFGTPAACCVVGAGVTGIALTGRQVASLDALLTTRYGQILIMKALTVGIAALLGLTMTIRLRRNRPASTDSLSRAVALESAALLLSLAAAAALSVSTPARGPAFTPTIAGGPSLVSAQVGDLLETAALVPNTVGQNWLRVDVNQTRRPTPGPVTGVSATLLGPGSRSSATRALVKADMANRWEMGGVDLTTPGSWRLTMSVQRAGRPDAVWRANWIIVDSPAVRRALVSDRPWQSALDHSALTIVMLTLGIGFIVAWMDRHQRRRVTTADRSTQPSMEMTKVRL